MIEAIGNLVRYIVILIFLATLLEMILPHGQFRRYLRMLVGILLILTLLSPIQNIMRLAPGWDVPVFLAAPTGQEELALILQRGEHIREDNYKGAIDNYRYRIKMVVNSLLAREFAAELVDLELSIDEDPHSNDFSAIQHMTVFAREKDFSAAEVSESPIEEIIVLIERNNEDNAKKDGEEELQEKKLAAAKARDISDHLTRYFLLTDQQVEVYLIP